MRDGTDIPERLMWQQNANRGPTLVYCQVCEAATRKAFAEDKPGCFSHLGTMRVRQPPQPALQNGCSLNDRTPTTQQRPRPPSCRAEPPLVQPSPRAPQPA